MRFLNHTMVLILIFMMFNSCEKNEKMDNEREKLIGVWQWIYAVKEHKITFIDLNYGPVGDSIVFDTILSYNGFNNCTLNFLKEGEVEILNMDKDIERYKLMFEGQACDTTGTVCKYKIYLDGNRFNQLICHVNNNMLITNRFPNTADNYDTLYKNYFIKN